jgi:hypothetical protein
LDDFLAKGVSLSIKKAFVSTEIGFKAHLSILVNETFMLLMAAKQDSNFPISSVMEKCKLHLIAFEAGDIFEKRKRE